MSFRQLWIILRARYALVLIVLLAVTATVLSVTLLLPKTYQATATLVLNYRGTDPITGVATPAQVMENFMATQVKIVTSEEAARRVVVALGLDRDPLSIRQFEAATGGRGDIRTWLGKRLLPDLEAIPVRSSSVLDIIYEHQDPEFAAAVANAFAQQYRALGVQLTVEPLRQASSFIDAQTRARQARLEAAQRKLSAYQQQEGIVSLDSRLDVETARLNELSSQLVIAQGQAMEASSRQRMAAGNAGVSPDVADNPLIQNLKASLGRAESKLSELSERYDRNHPLYQSARAEVDQLRADLDREIRNTAASVGNNAQILRQREAEIRAALAAQKAKVLALNRARDGLAVLEKEVETAEQAYRAAAERHAETNLQGQSNQSEAAILSPALAPTEPAGPNVLFFALAAAVLGTALGIGLALLTEMMNRRVRCEDDLVELLGVPMLGEIDWRRVRQRRSGFLPSFAMRRRLAGRGVPA